MISRANNSYLISFEGIEGSGKTTQVKLFTKLLTDQGYTVHVFREPGTTEFGEKIRDALLSSQKGLNPLGQCLAFCAARAQLLHEVVGPLLLKKDTIVILDRYLDSTYAYQGFAFGLDIETITDLHNKDILKTRPDITFYLKISLEISMQRQQKRGNNKDYFESQPESFYQKLIDGYDYCAKTFNKRVKTIDASLSVDEVSALIQKQFERYKNE
jgi:dTMP kinase